MLCLCCTGHRDTCSIRNAAFRETAREAGVIGGLDVYGMQHISEVATFLNGGPHPEPVRVNIEQDFIRDTIDYGMDFSEVKGQSKVKRALEIAAAGGHNLLRLYIV